MGTRTVPVRYRGIMRPDPRWEFWGAQSGFYDNGGTRQVGITSASPHAGIASPSEATDMALRTSGAQTDDVEIYANRPGLPILDEAGVLWKLASDGNAMRRGKDLPVPQAAWQPIDLSATRFYFHAVTLPNDKVIECYQDIAGATYTRTLEADADYTWGAEITVDSQAITNGYPCLLVVPRVDGYRVYLFRWGDDGTDYQVRRWYSDDDGATWTDDGWALADTLDASAITSRHRLRAAYLNGQILLIGHVLWNATGVTSRERIIQWASSDGGVSFTHVLTSDGTDWDNAGAWIDVTTWRGEFVLGRLIYDGAQASPAFRRLASAWYPWTSGSDDSNPSALTSAQHWGLNPGSGVDATMAEGELAIVTDDVGAIYAYGRHCAGGDDGACAVIRSNDGADSWTIMGKHPIYPAAANNGSAWWNAAAPGVIISTDNELMNFCAVHQRGRTIVVTSWRRAGGGGATNYHAAIYLGGWQNVPMPSLVNAQRPNQRCAWDFNGCGMHLPSEGVWTLTLAGAGAPSETWTAGRIVQTAGAVSSVTNDYTFTSTVAQGLIGEWSLEVVSGTAFIEIKTSGSTPIEYDVQVSVTTTQVTLYDKKAAAVIGSAYTYSGGGAAGTRIRIRFAVEGDEAVCWTRDDDSALGSQDLLTESDRPWVEVARTATLTSAAVDTGMSVRFICGASSAVTWDEWMISAGKYTGQGLYTQPDRLKYGGDIIESPAWLGKGVKASAVTGPTVTGDTWDVATTADYPPNAVLPNVSPSPRHPHRTTTAIGYNDGTARWSWSRSTAAEDMFAPYMAVLLDGLNFGEPAVYLRYGAAWNLAATVGYWSFTADRYGDTLVVNTGANANSAVLRRDELVGCLVEEVSGGFVANQARVLENAPGHIDTTAGLSVPLKLLLDRDASGWGAAPVVRIYPRRALLIIDLQALSQQVAGIQIRAPLESLDPGPFSPPKYPPETYYEIATMAAGPLWAFGSTHSWGYRMATEQDTELITAEDGTRISYERSPVRRRWSLTWAEPVSMHDIEAGAPDFIAGKAAGSPLALLRNTPIDLADQLRALAGSHTPVVYCPSIDTAGTGKEEQWADGAMVCRIVSSVERDNVVGDEERDEAARVQELILEEEV